VRNQAGIRVENLRRAVGRQNALAEWNQHLAINRNDNVTGCYNGRFMLDLLLALLAAGRVFFRSRTDTALEVLALRQQVAVLKRKHHPRGTPEKRP
jgi:hypothetical protein